jgi:hypothetical protein
MSISAPASLLKSREIKRLNIDNNCDHLKGMTLASDGLVNPQGRRNGNSPGHENLDSSIFAKRQES